MTDRPMTFFAPEVRALLDGRKTQTRRCGKRDFLRSGIMEWNGKEMQPLPAYAPGDRLWCREALSMGHAAGTPICHATYRADGADLDLTPSGAIAWAERQARNTISPIHMPRWASRLTLTVTDVRVQRVQEISEEDAISEGCPSYYEEGRNPIRHSARDEFSYLWDRIHGFGAWERNDWVSAISFEVEQRNIDDG